MKYSIIIFPLCLLPAFCIAQTSDPAFCQELLQKAQTALDSSNWNRARDYCETALPLCPNFAGQLGALLKKAGEGVDGEKALAKKKEEEAAAERDKAKAALTELEKSRSDVIKFLLQNADAFILKLEYDSALVKIKDAASLVAAAKMSSSKLALEKQKVANALLEIAFWHGEASNTQRATALLDSAAALVNKKAAHLQPFRESIESFDTAVYNKMMERYYPVMVKVEGGTFDMGCDPKIDPNCESDETLHKQEVSSFQIAKYETTWWQYYLFCKATGNEYESPGWGTDGNNPVVNVSWFDAVAYCNWVSVQKGESKAIDTSNYTVTLRAGYRLPTEAEWEYAAKGGNRPDNTVYSGSNELDEVGWYSSNSGSRTQPVGSPRKKTNGLGLHDMSGNVWEWCWDWKADYPKDFQPDYKGPESGRYRVLRGGSWYYVVNFCRVSIRYYYYPVNRFNDLGFRCARVF